MARFQADTLNIRDDRSAVLANNWWLVAIRGVLAIVFGIVALVLPGAAMLALVAVFAAYSFIDGIFNIALAVRGARHHERWALFLVNGMAGLLIGLAAVLMPGLTVLVFVFMIALWALISAGMLFGSAASLKSDHGRWLLIAGALISAVYGVVLLVTPFIGALVLTWWIGAYSVVFGIVMIALSLRLRPHRGKYPYSVMNSHG
jgi:uncharacterized membrane protein HdeD (DUF308 family)